MNKSQFDEHFDSIYETLRLKVDRDRIYKLYKKVTKTFKLNVLKTIIYIVQKTEYDDFDDIEFDFDLEVKILKSINFNIFCKRSSKKIDVSTDTTYYKKELFGETGKFATVTNVDDTTIVKWYINPYDKTISIPGEFLKEVAILKCLNHPNIVNIKGVIITKQIVGIVMEKLHTSLFDIVISGKEVPKFKKKINECLAYMHNLGVYHHDIHEGNIMFDSEMNPKLIDFNLAVVCNDRYPEYEIIDRKQLKDSCFFG